MQLHLCNGVALKVQIRSLEEENKFGFSATALGANLAGTTKPVKVKLVVGLNGGSAVAKDDID